MANSGVGIDKLEKEIAGCEQDLATARKSGDEAIIRYLEASLVALQQEEAALWQSVAALRRKEAALQERENIRLRAQEDKHHANAIQASLLI